MKKLLLSLSMAALLPSMALADSFDVDLSKNNWGNQSAYKGTNSSKVEFGGSKWDLNNFPNNNGGWNYIKGGGKNSTTDCYLTNTTALSQKINKVSVTVDAITTSNGTVESASVIVADDNNFTNAATYNFSGDKATQGTWEINITEPAANKFYKVNFNVKNTNASKNGVIQISKFTFDYEAEAGFVQAPTMTPAAGWVMNGTKVELAAQDGASIFYTTDGTAPTTTSTAYTEPITVDKDMTIKAIAKLNEDLSEVKENEYKVYAVNSAEAPLTPTQANALIDANFDQNIQVYVGGTISEIDNVDVTEYHNATYTIKGEDGGEIIVFRGKYLDNQGFTAEDQIGIGDKVVVYGKLINFNGTKEINSNNYIVSIEKAPETKCATPTFSVESGTTLLKGDVVTISTTTEGAVIVYTIGETTTTSESNTVDVTINETCTITAKATKEGLDDSAEATATYTVKQLGEREYEYTFDFTGDEAYGMTLGEYNKTGEENVYTCNGENITLTLNGSTRWWEASKSKELRFYTSSSFTVAGKAEGTMIKEIELIGANANDWSVEASTLGATSGYSKGTWTGNQNSVTFKNGITKGNTAIQKIKVLYQVPSAVETIEAETEAPARYFNLQGVEVANPANGLYIRVQGKKATKVIL
jgi:hypothetical protein